MTPAAGRLHRTIAAPAGNNDISGFIEEYQTKIEVLQKALEDPILDREGRIGIKKKIYLLELNIKILYRMNICRSSAFDR